MKTRTLARIALALASTAAILMAGDANAGGEIWMLDSANFNTGTVAVTKSITILAVPGAQVLLNGVTLTQNGTGVGITGATATVFTRQNNTFKFNTADLGSGTLTPLAAQ